MKAYVLKVGEYGFVFSTSKMATMAFDLLEAAEFFGREGWGYPGTKLVECSEGISVRRVDKEELRLQTLKEHTRQVAIEGYQSAVKSGSNPERLKRALEVLQQLGIDPETVEIEEE